ncbi:hypothetical protein G5V59_27185 [Nocardioides sp. W3-2-3]|uniref:DUF5666 domain-containing protein n=1 Tax=Nocardioides convexus TaxID=2712224 RepID=UPI0024188E9F|nr:DUF5666 domain-containing protein [Nocardioides convexus]NHA02074.1 hypothetical protein [Nocardioides convexus]
MNLATLTRPVGAATCGLALAALLAGCGSDDATDSAPAASGSSAAAPGSGGPGGGGMPGTSGLIAAVDGSTLQVQNQMTGQVAVTFNGSTKVTDQAAATLADVTTGACVVVRTADSGSASAGTDAAPSAVTASSVAVSAATSDGCAGGFGGGPGGGPGDTGNGQRPSGMPTDRPSDLPSDAAGRGGRPGGFGTVGEVTSVSDGRFVVEGPNGDVTVTVGSSTTYTRQVASTSKALTQGRCVRVQGDADDTGAVTASTIQVSDAEDGQCVR